MLVSIPVESLTTKQTLHEILRALQPTDTGVSDARLLAVAAQIVKNTHDLSLLTTDPPVGPVPEQRKENANMTVDPMESVEAALAAQTAAIAGLSSELAVEHQQWLDAVAAGDTAQAAAVVAKVEANTAQLNAMTASLESSDPSEPAAVPPIQTLPGDIG